MSKEIMEDLLSGKIDAGLVDEKWVPKIIGIKNYSKNHMM